jgi:hypothetical protein
MVLVVRLLNISWKLNFSTFMSFGEHVPHCTNGSPTLGICLELTHMYRARYQLWKYMYCKPLLYKQFSLRDIMFSKEANFTRVEV